MLGVRRVPSSNVPKTFFQRPSQSAGSRMFYSADVLTRKGPLATVWCVWAWPLPLFASSHAPAPCGKCRRTDGCVRLAAHSKCNKKLFTVRLAPHACHAIPWLAAAKKRPRAELQCRRVLVRRSQTASAGRDEVASARFCAARPSKIRPRRWP